MNIEPIINAFKHYDFAPELVVYVSSWLNQHAQSIEKVTTDQDEESLQKLGFLFKTVGLRFNQDKALFKIVLTFYKYPEMEGQDEYDGQYVQVSLVFSERECRFVEKTVLFLNASSEGPGNGFKSIPSRIKHPDYELGQNPDIKLHKITDVTALGYHWALVEHAETGTFEVMEFLD